MTVYQGDRTIQGPVVLRDGAALGASREIALYSEHGMDWGCESEQSRQLAFALLLDHFGDAERARNLVPAFTQRVVAALDNEWELDSEYLDEVSALIEHR